LAFKSLRDSFAKEASLPCWLYADQSAHSWLILKATIGSFAADEAFYWISICMKSLTDSIMAVVYLPDL
jgi:hypothetical protein